MSELVEQLVKSIWDPSVHDPDIVELLRGVEKSQTIDNMYFYDALLTSGRPAALQLALSEGWMDPNHVDDEGTTSIGMLIFAAMEGENIVISHGRKTVSNSAILAESLIQLLEAGADPNGVIYSDYTPLDMCLAHYVPHMASIILIYGGDPFLAGDPDNTPPYAEAKQSKKRKWFRQLVDKAQLIKDGS